MYDYDKQTEEELSFKEGEKFNIYDLSDPDWLLVGDASNQLFGFVPSNYIELDSAAGAAPVLAPTPAAPIPQYVPKIAPPPQHPSLVHESPANIEEPEPEPEQAPPQPTRQAPASYNHYNEEPEDEAPPPMPARPLGGDPNALQRTTTGLKVGEYEDEVDINPNNEHNFDGEFFTWYIDEVDGRKKRPVKFSIGKGFVIIKPNTTNPKKLKLKSSTTLDNEWTIRDLKEFSHEKKHVFLEFKNPTASIELHAGSKDVAEAIISILGDVKGADNARGLREVASASKANTDSSNRKVGRLLFDFSAHGDDELNSREGDEVYIINDTKSKDWWMCENITTKRQGVIPSSYIEIVGTSNLDKLTDGPQRRKSQKSSSKGRVVEGSRKHHHRSRDERDRVRERDRAQRDKADHHNENDKSMPNYHRVRTWIDSSGSFKVEAEFLGCVEGKIHLHKTNGVKIAVAANKLSMEDLEYVEKVTGTSLAQFKDEVAKQTQKRERAKSTSGGKSAMAAINDIPPPQPSRPKATTAISTSEPEYDWFEFFLQCGIDIGNCQRYTLNFNREQMDENILQDITPSLLRTLGLREGDILRVMKFLDNKFDRKKPAEESAVTAGGLFTEVSGALKNNSSNTEISKVNANALPTPSPSIQQQQQQPPPQPQQQQPPPSNRFEDDAWAVKPAARSSEDLLKPASRPETPQYTGSLQDLVNIKPLELNNVRPAVPEKDKPVYNNQAPSAPVLIPTKSGNLAQPGDKYAVQTTGTGALKPVPPQLTAGFIPAQNTGFVTAQPTGFIPIQPTGFIPIQQTGLQPQITFGIIPLQTGTTTFPAQRTGGQIAPAPPATSFGQIQQPVLQTGSVTMPQTSFGSTPLMSNQFTGGVITGGPPPQTSFGDQLSLQRTGPLVPTQRTGGFVPQSAFGQQITGGVMPQPSFGANPFPVGGQATGGLPPSTTFGSQITGGFQPQAQNPFPQASFNGQATGGGFPQTSFGQPTGGFPQTSFGQPTGGFQQQPQQQQFGAPNMNQITNMFQNTGFGSPVQTPQQFPQTSFGQPAYGQQQPVFGQQQQQSAFAQQQSAFGQQQPVFGQQQQQFPNTTFGQPQQLQSQPTGLGFGNGPQSLQSQPTGRANLLAATPDNPFGF